MPFGFYLLINSVLLTYFLVESENGVRYDD